jgi:hypothetical protein
VKKTLAKTQRRKGFFVKLRFQFSLKSNNATSLKKMVVIWQQPSAKSYNYSEKHQLF